MILEIVDPEKDSSRKYYSAVEALQKALKFKPEDENHAEESPFHSLNDMKDYLFKIGDERLYQVYQELARNWFTIQKAEPGMPFRVNGKIHINPRTGKPLTLAEWRKIKEGLRQGLRYTFKDLASYLAYEPIALAKILRTMPEADAFKMPLNKLDLKKARPREAFFRNSLKWAQQSAAIHIQDISSKAQTKVQQLIITAHQSKWGVKQLADELFKVFANINKDWRLVAITEMQINFSSGFLLSELERAKKDGEKYPILMGVSGPKACKECKRLIDHKYFVLLPDEPAGGSDKIRIKGERYTAIWPGKLNIGVSRGSWKPTIPLHPNCLCSWARVSQDKAEVFQEFTRVNDL